MVNNPFGIRPILCIDRDNFGSLRTNSVIKNPKYKITKLIKAQIISILKLVYYKDIDDINFHECLNRRFINSLLMI